MNNKKDILKMLLPVLAVVIVIESVVVVSRLKNKNKPVEMEYPDVNVTNNSTESARENKGPVVADVSLVSDSTSFKVGEKYNVDVVVSAKENLQLDAIDLLIGYDPAKMVVADLNEGEGLTATSKKVSDKTGNVVVNFWSMEKSGYSFEKGTTKTLVSFSVEPKVAGDLELSVIDKSDAGGTKLVSTVNEKAVVNNYSSQKLAIKVTN